MCGARVGVIRPVNDEKGSSSCRQKRTARPFGKHLGLLTPSGVRSGLESCGALPCALQQKQAQRRPSPTGLSCGEAGEPQDIPNGHHKAQCKKNLLTEPELRQVLAAQQRVQSSRSSTSTSEPGGSAAIASFTRRTCSVSSSRNSVNSSRTPGSFTCFMASS